MAKIPYANAIGNLMYIMLCTRLDLAYVVNFLSRYMVDSCRDHWKALKRL